MTELATPHLGSEPVEGMDLPLLLEDMLLARRMSERLWSLQRQGHLTTFPPLTGQEGAVAGVMCALDEHCDWVVPAYRELAGLGRLGDAVLQQVVRYWRGHPDGGRVPDGVRCLPPQIALAAQVPHAVGLAWGMQLRGEAGVVWVFLGDGATSEGDFYEGMNLAGVQRVPLVLVCINNGWAISTPASRQTAAESFAAKAAAAGIAGVRVDGNDAVAVWDAAQAARRQAVEGGGPTLLEVVTYRVGPHTNSDDPTRYVPEADLAAWRDRDPIEMLSKRLRDAGAWDDSRERAVIEAIEQRLERVIQAALSEGVDTAAAFDHLWSFDDMRHREQQEQLIRSLTPFEEA